MSSQDVGEEPMEKRPLSRHMTLLVSLWLLGASPLIGEELVVVGRFLDHAPDASIKMDTSARSDGGWQTSGLTYDGKAKRWWSIGDQNSREDGKTSHAGRYLYRLTFDDGEPLATPVKIWWKQKSPDFDTVRRSFRGQIDFEGIVADPTRADVLFACTEGDEPWLIEIHYDAAKEVASAVRSVRIATQGNHHVEQNGDVIQPGSNTRWEGLAISSDGKTLYLATQWKKSPSRIYSVSTETVRSVQWRQVNGKWIPPTVSPAGLIDSGSIKGTLGGLSTLCYHGREFLLVLERDSSHLDLVDLTNVRGKPVRVDLSLRAPGAANGVRLKGASPEGITTDGETIVIISDPAKEYYKATDKKGMKKADEKKLSNLVPLVFNFEVTELVDWIRATHPETAHLFQVPAPLDITTGHEIPSEGYCDQPYVVKLEDGTWLCTMTTGTGHEGGADQHIVSCRSADQGRTWEPLVDIEPADGPEASWVMPYLTSYGRVYAFYTYNADNLREVIGGGRRVDTLGSYAFKYTDDGGRTWSDDRWIIPIRETDVDRANPYQGRVRFFWGVGKPIRHKGAMVFGFAKIGKFGKNFIEQSESWFLRCANIDTERDPSKLAWQLLPDFEEGLRSPKGPIAEEVNLTSLSDGSLFCTYRTTAGHPCHAYSRDDGKTWTPAAFMTYGPGGPLIDHPRAANFVRKLSQGPYAGRFIYWFHNHGGTSYQGRNPAYLLGGVEVDGPDGKLIQWGKPVAVLMDKDLNVRISYPDFVWDDGLHITETQKSIARVHSIPDELLRTLWATDEEGQNEDGGH